MQLRVMQYNCQRSLSIVADVEGRFNEDMVDIYLLQEPYVAHGQVCGLGSGLDVYCLGERPKAAVAVRKGVGDVVLRNEWSNECMAVAHITLGNQKILVVSLYCQYGGDIAQDIELLRRVVQGSSSVPLLLGLDANATSMVWHSKNIQAARDRDIRGDILAEYIVESGLLVLNEDSECFTFAGPVGSSDIDVTLANASLERIFAWEWNVRPELGVSDHNPMVIDLKVINCDGRVQEDDRVCTNYLRNEDAKIAFRASILGNADSLGLETFQRLSLEMCQHIEGWVEVACKISQTKQNCKDLVRWWTPSLSIQRRQVRHLRRLYQTMMKRSGRNGNTSTIDGDEVAEVKRRWRYASRQYKVCLRKAKFDNWKELYTRQRK